MKKKLAKLFIFLLTIAIISAGSIFYAIYISPDKLVVDYHTISSTQIPKSLDNINIGYFSDIYYLEFMNEERLTKMINKINESDVDVILFGGDLFANPSDSNIDADTINKLTTLLSSLDAPLGKFYVLGDIDKTNNDTTTLVSNILYNAGFEDLINKNIKLHNGSFENITLIGLDNSINGTVDIQSAFTNTSSDSFNILFTHTPDSLLSISNSSVNIAFAGHSLGGQITLPFFGAFSQIEGASKYVKGVYNVGNSEFLISDGLGTTKYDMRLFCPPQFNIYRLSSNQ